VRTISKGAAEASPDAAVRAAFCCQPMGGSTESAASAGTSMHLQSGQDASELQQRVWRRPMAHTLTILATLWTDIPPTKQRKGCCLLGSGPLDQVIQYRKFLTCFALMQA